MPSTSTVRVRPSRNGSIATASFQVCGNSVFDRLHGNILILKITERVIKLIIVPTPVYFDLLLNDRFTHLLDALDGFTSLCRTLPDAVPDCRILHQPPHKYDAAQYAVRQPSREMTTTAHSRSAQKVIA